MSIRQDVELIISARLTHPDLYKATTLTIAAAAQEIRRTRRKSSNSK